MKVNKELPYEFTDEEYAEGFEDGYNTALRLIEERNNED